MEGVTDKVGIQISLKLGKTGEERRVRWMKELKRNVECL